MATIEAAFFGALTSVDALFYFQEEKMKNKFGRSAVFAGIAMVLTIAFGTVLNNSIINLIGYSKIVRYILLMLNVIESAAAFFLSIKFASKLILKKDVPVSKILPLSVAAGLVEAVLIFLIPINVALLSYIITFAVFFVFALALDKTVDGAGQLEDGEPVQKETPNKPKITANEEMSAKAQYAFNEKLSKVKETATIIDDIVEAKLFAQAIELQLLKSPATAQFCSLEEMTVTSSGDVYIVSGYVDSQNSYGAVVRTPFKITVFKENGAWKNTNKFISTSAVIEGKMISHTLLWWILGIIGSIITFLVYYFTIMSNF